MTDQWDDKAREIVGPQCLLGGLIEDAIEIAQVRLFTDSVATALREAYERGHGAGVAVTLKSFRNPHNQFESEP